MRWTMWIGCAAAALIFLASPSAAEAAPEDGAETAETGSEVSSGGFFVIPPGNAGVALGAGLGAGLVAIGGARGIGRIGGSAVESIARQPEAGGRVFTSMLISAALIEGFTFFGLVVPLLAVLGGG